jgi:SAM-dependent methyltransferase
MRAQAWDAQGYDAQFSFVTAYGDVLLPLLAAQAGELVLDIGCGTGHQAAALAMQGAVVVGVDSDAAMLDTARAEHPSIRFVQADAQQPAALRGAVGGRAVDAVLSNAALHWMPDQDAVVAGIAGVLRPGGRLVVEMGGAGNVARTAEAIRSGRAAVGLDPDVPLPWTFPSPGEQASRLERHGFVVRTVALVDRPTPLADRVTTSGWARMFGASLVADVPDADRSAFDAAVDAAASQLGLDHRPDGRPGWWADYTRLRFTAALG